MATTVASVKAANPEFEKCPDALIQDRIDRATRSISSSEYGDQFDDAVSSLTMHLVAISPWGQNARMVNKEGSSTYFVEYERITRSRVARQMTAGTGSFFPPGGWDG